MQSQSAADALKKLRRKVRRLYREHIALCVFFHGVSSRERPQLKASMEKITALGRRELREFQGKLQQANGRIARQYGLRIPVAEIVKITEKAEAGNGLQLLLSKSFIQTACS